MLTAAVSCALKSVLVAGARVSQAILHAEWTECLIQVNIFTQMGAINISNVHKKNVLKNPLVHEVKGALMYE